MWTEVAWLGGAEQSAFSFPFNFFLLLLSELINFKYVISFHLSWYWIVDVSLGTKTMTVWCAGKRITINRDPELSRCPCARCLDWFFVTLKLVMYRTDKIFFPSSSWSLSLPGLEQHYHVWFFFLPCMTSFKWILHRNKAFWITLKCYSVFWHVPGINIEQMNLLIAPLQMTPKRNSVSFLWAKNPGLAWLEPLLLILKVSGLLKNDLSLNCVVGNVQLFADCWRKRWSSSLAVGQMMMLSSLMWDPYSMAAYSIKASLGKSFVKVSRKDIIPPLPDSVAKKHMCKQSHRNMTGRKWGSGRAILRDYILQSYYVLKIIYFILCAWLLCLNISTCIWMPVGLVDQKRVLDTPWDWD